MHLQRNEEGLLWKDPTAVQDHCEEHHLEVEEGIDYRYMYGQPNKTN